MPMFSVEYTYAEGAATVRDEHRPAHREFLGALHESGDLLFVGPFTDGSGAALMVVAGDETAARALLAPDPFAAADAIETVTVREWKQVYGPF
ncbi:YciI family protein [Gordonia sp. (in: high G+C Gram-positive bacteria)]|uniref:YciI family protein n=1 Tax=Gordonia sp. (in: high G+C Gram-positive bacteria) TaxID=84139 RepID=UPI003F9CD9B2